MSIASEITRIQTAKADIKSAIEEKGVTVPSSALLDDYADYIDEISGGGGTASLVDRTNSKGTTAEITADSSIEITGTLPVTANGTYDVSEYAYTNVNIDPDDWVRPSNYPDYSKLNLTGQEAVYFSVDANDRDSAYFYVRFSGTNVVCEKGVLENGVFTSNVTVATKSGNNQWFSDYVTESDVLDSNGFIVYKVSGTITVVYSYSDKVTLNGRQVRSSESACVEVYGRLPNLTTITFRSNIFTQSITLFGLSSLTSLQNAFYPGDNLIKVKLTGLSALTNAGSAFYNSSFLRIIDLDGYDTKTLTESIGSMFRGCSRLRRINAVLDFSKVVGHSFDSVFREAKLFTSYNSIKSYGSPTNFNYSFYNNQSMTSFDSSKVVSFSNCENLNYTFAGCYMLKEVDLSQANLSSVTSTTSTFQQCRTLKKVVLPSSLTVVGATFFSDCTLLQEVHFASTTPPTCANTNAWNNVPNTCKIYVPYSANHSVLTAYQTATNWSTVASYLVEEEP